MVFYHIPDTANTVAVVSLASTDLFSLVLQVESSLFLRHCAHPPFVFPSILSAPQCHAHSAKLCSRSVNQRAKALQESFPDFSLLD